MTFALGALFAAIDPPRWVWATLVMAAFVAVSLLTMFLARYPVRRAPPPVAPPSVDEHTPPRAGGSPHD